jgi:hypothetical protein
LEDAQVVAAFLAEFAHEHGREATARGAEYAVVAPGA